MSPLQESHDQYVCPAFRRTLGIEPIRVENRMAVGIDRQRGETLNPLATGRLQNCLGQLRYGLTSNRSFASAPLMTASPIRLVLDAE
jgi:hypothetical protein